MKKAIDFREPKPFYGIKKPLFDLLIDDDAAEASEDYSKNFMDVNGVVDSVISEISKILNTRRSAPKKDYDDMQDNILNFALPTMFGMPDFQSFDGTNSNQWVYIARLCEKAIHVYEPRIKNVFVKVDGFNKQKQALEVTIKGTITMGKLVEQVTFPLDLTWAGAR